jgi:6-pyruvoyl-tetrahydropterin synthase
MFSVTVRDHTMIAHSFSSEVFGPAQRLHGATYVVDAEFSAKTLDIHGIVVDIGAARSVLREILAELDYRNLDEMPAFRGKNTTTEFMCQVVCERLAVRLEAGELGRTASELSALQVTLRESHVAWASFRKELSR